MNTLELNFGYLSWTDVDERAGVAVRSTPDLLRFFFATPWPWQSVLKCHYAPGLLPVLPRLARRFDVLWIVREPADTLRSFWRYVRGGAGEGPRCATPGEFVRARPSGAMLRYQATAAGTVAERWCAHAAAWLAAHDAAEGAITLLLYADLDQRLAETVARLGERLRRPSGPLVRPHQDRKVIVHPRAAELTADYDAADRDFLAGATADTWAAVRLAAERRS